MGGIGARGPRPSGSLGGRTHGRGLAHTLSQATALSQAPHPATPSDRCGDHTGASAHTLAWTSFSECHPSLASLAPTPHLGPSKMEQGLQ